MASAFQFSSLSFYQLNKQLENFMLNFGIRPTITSNNLDLLFADLKLGIIDMYLRRLKERQHRKK